MTKVGTETAGTFDTARVVRRTFQVLAANIPVFSVFAIVLELPQLAAAYLLNPPATVTDGFLVISGVADAASMIADLFCRSMLTVVLIHGTIVTLNGGRATFAGCLAAGLRNTLPVVALTLLAWIGEGLGLLLFVVPGVVLTLMWIVIAPVYVVERTPIMTAFERSAALTRDNRGQIFALVLVFYILAAVAGHFAKSPSWSFLTSLNDVGFSVFFVSNGIVRAVTDVLAGVGIASIYYELRIVKEGVGSKQLAEVFA